VGGIADEKKISDFSSDKIKNGNPKLCGELNEECKKQIR